MKSIFSFLLEHWKAAFAGLGALILAGWGLWERMADKSARASEAKAKAALKLRVQADKNAAKLAKAAQKTADARARAEKENLTQQSEKAAKALKTTQARTKAALEQAEDDITSDEKTDPEAQKWADTALPDNIKDDLEEKK